MIQVEHPAYLLALLGLPLVIALYFFVLRWKRRSIERIGDAALVQALIKDYSPKKFSLKFILVAIAFTLGVIAWANPRIPTGSVKENFNGIDVMIALDVSNSMLAQDIKPDRLERAKEFISRLIDQLPNDRIGLVVFAGRAYLQMPLTIDHDAAKMYLSTASTNTVPTQGTVIGDALKMCYAGFNPKEKKYRSIILITDGEDHDDNAIKISKQLAAAGVMINTVGIGTTQGSSIPDPITHLSKKDASGNIVFSQLNEQELKEIATNGNGIYQLFDNTDNVISNLNAQLKTIGQKTYAANALINYESFYQWFLGAALLLLAIDFFLAETKRTIKTKPAVVKKAVTLSLLMLCVSFSYGQDQDAVIRKGNKDYKQKKFDEAIANYQKATAADSSDYKAWYNLGNALYKKGKPDDAIHAYDEAIQNADSASNKEAAWYNKGVALQNNKKLPQCIDAYKNALRLDPTDADARLNLQKALLQMKQQQPPPKQDSTKQPQQPKDQKKKEPEKQQEQQQPQQQQMSKEDAEEKLKALSQQEQNLQDKLRKGSANALDKPAKDW